MVNAGPHPTYLEHVDQVGDEPDPAGGEGEGGGDGGRGVDGPRDGLEQPREPHDHEQLQLDVEPLADAIHLLDLRAAISIHENYQFRLRSHFYWHQNKLKVIQRAAIGQTQGFVKSFPESSTG